MNVATKQVNSLPLRPTTLRKQFYQFKQAEFTSINHKEQREEKTMLFHCAVKPEFGYLHMQVETFRIERKSTTLSVSDKDLLFHLDQVVNKLNLLVTTQGNITGISNLKAVQAKLHQKIQHLATTYSGEKAEQFFHSWENMYQNEKRAIEYLQHYSQLGLLLPKNAHGTVNFYNLIKNTPVSIHETIDKQKIPQGFELMIQGTAQSVNLAVWQQFAQTSNLQVNPEEHPKLETYQGYALLNHAGIVLQSDLKIVFTYGQHYKKMIHYQLNSINHEAI